MDKHQHFELVTETYPPDVNGVALTVQSLEQGLRSLGHRVALIRTEQAEERLHAQPDLMLVDGAPIPRYPGLRFGLPAGRRLLARWKAQRPDAIYIATEGPLGWSALRAARQLGIPVATGFHTRFDDYVGRYGAGFLAPWVFAWLRRFHNRGDATLVPTQELQQQLANQGFRQVERLGRAVDTRQFHPGWRDGALRASWGLNDDDIAVLSVGRLAPEKKLGLLLRSFRALKVERPNAKLIFVGDGPSRAALQATNPDVIFSGIQRGDELARHYASADLFLFPSLTETFGNVTTEALASGLPVVAFDYAAAAQVIRPQENGLLAPFGDAAAFQHCAAELAADPVRCRAMGLQARVTAQALDWDGIVARFEAMLTSVIGQASGFVDTRRLPVIRPTA